MTWIPHVTVACVLQREHKFLLVEERINGQLVLNQPAGHWEQGETLLEASVRETLEETAWRYQPSYLTGIYQWQHPGSGETYLRFCFTGELLEFDSQRKLDKEIEQVVWLDEEQLKNRIVEHRSPLVQQCIDDYIKDQRFELSIIHAM